MLLLDARACCERSGLQSVELPSKFEVAEEADVEAEADCASTEAADERESVEKPLEESRVASLINWLNW